MRRDTSALMREYGSPEGYDLLVVGAGIHGASIARAAALRGLSVALVDQGDFGGATSANSMKTIHGGFRYLQHADFARVRESSQARSTLLRIAPHLVHLLPVVVPVYGHGARGREAFAVALAANDFITRDRNHGLGRDKQIPRGRVISREECLRLLPGIPAKGLTGGALFYDAQVYNSERMTIALVKSAQQAGAEALNYARVVRFLQEGDRVEGAVIRDTLSGEEFEVRARVVVNAAGPWVGKVLKLLDRESCFPVRYAKAFNVVVDRLLFETYGVGLSGLDERRDETDIISRESRNFFIVPWRGKSIVGTGHGTREASPDNFAVTEDDIQSFLYEVNKACPSLNIKREEISFVHGGLLPTAGDGESPEDMQPARHDRIYDHRKEGITGIVTVAGVKYTTALSLAERVVDTALPQVGKQAAPAAAQSVPVYGGQMESFANFLEEQLSKRPCDLSDGAIRRLAANYGSALPVVLRYFDWQNGAGTRLSEEQAVLRAETLHALYEEMAQRLGDVVLRRTELGSAGHPGNDKLRFCAEVMASQLEWDEEKIEQELRAVQAVMWYDVRAREPVRVRQPRPQPVPQPPAIAVPIEDAASAWTAT